MGNPNPLSPRMSFQWKWFEHAAPSLDGEPTVLNIGCADDPLGFGEGARHVDIDDWTTYHKYFTQADAHKLPFDDRSYDVVILGDIIEHAHHPHVMMKEAARVCSRLLVVTVFEEWKHKGPGQHIEEAWELADKESQELGYKDRMDYQEQVYPDKVQFPEEEVPHLFHINQLTDQDMNILIRIIVEEDGFLVREARKAYEATFADGHRMFNWLVCLERVR